MADTPVLLIAFNRPARTRKVMEKIAEARPKRLYIAVDGPRSAAESDVVAETVEVIRQLVTWDCNPIIRRSEANLGCKVGPASAIDWVFSIEDRAIIIEDDCMPSMDFFRFCDEILESYKDDQRIMAVSGNNFLFDRIPISKSYYFSKLPSLWGWATWKRAWVHNDLSMRMWPVLKESGWLYDHLGNTNDARWWSSMFDYVHERNLDTWDYQWILSMWMQNALVINPAVNLVTNIGFGEDATHTSVVTLQANHPTRPMSFPLTHQRYVMPNVLADAFYSRHFLGIRGFSEL